MATYRHIYEGAPAVYAGQPVEIIAVAHVDAITGQAPATTRSTNLAPDYTLRFADGETFGGIWAEQIAGADVCGRCGSSVADVAGETLHLTSGRPVCHCRACGQCETDRRPLVAAVEPVAGGTVRIHAAHSTDRDSTWYGTAA